MIKVNWIRIKKALGLDGPDVQPLTAAEIEKLQKLLDDIKEEDNNEKIIRRS